MDAVIMKIMNFAQTLVDADRTSLFLVDGKTDELYARIFDSGTGLETTLDKEIRFSRTKGVAGKGIIESADKNWGYRSLISLYLFCSTFWDKHKQAIKRGIKPWYTCLDTQY